MQPEGTEDVSPAPVEARVPAAPVGGVVPEADAPTQPKLARPAAVWVAGLVFGQQAYHAVKDFFITDNPLRTHPSYLAMYALLLLPAFLWLFKPRWKGTYYVGSLHLILSCVGVPLAMVLMGTAASYWNDGFVLTFLIITGIPIVGLSLLAWRYIFGKPTRRYFGWS